MTAGKTATFAEHIQELRSRLMWSMLFVLIGAVVGYFLHEKLLVVLQQPLNDKLYYTTPTGAFSFVIKVCTAFGFIVALPVLIYHTFSFLGPLITGRSKRLVVGFVSSSLILACLGMLFAYYISLPAALKFLVNFGNNAGNIQSLITANEYFNFVLAYIAGFAALFQLPLVMLFINKIKPLSPKKMLGTTRYVILGSFIIAAVLTPTPDPFNQTLMAGPIILLYFLSVGMVSIINRTKFRKSLETGDWLKLSETTIDNILHDVEEPLDNILQPIPQLQPVPVTDENPPIQQPMPPQIDEYKAPQQPIDLGIKSRGAPTYQSRDNNQNGSKVISDFIQ